MAEILQVKMNQNWPGASLAAGMCNFSSAGGVISCGVSKETPRQAEAMQENGGRWQVQQAVQQGETRSK